jgi:hypothetical protein
MTVTPVFQVKKNLGAAYDHDYVVGLPAAQAAVASGYEIDCVAFCAQDGTGTGLLEFKRYLDGGYHFYTTNPADEHLRGWTYTPASTTAWLYAPASVPIDGWVNLARYVDASYGWAHFFTADTTHNPPPAGYAVEPTGRTGWVRPVTRVEFTVSYDGSGQASGVTVTGGNATGQHVTIDGTDYVMQADDALVGFGAGNWIRYTRDPSDTHDWHFDDVVVAGPSNATFTRVTYADDLRIALVDDDENNASSDEAYEYTLKIKDVPGDRTISYDPKLINRTSISPGPH